MTTLPLEKPVQQQKIYDAYKVLLHNDDHNDMFHVVQSISKAVPQRTQQEAIAIMEEAHTQGVAIVITAPLEYAEMYVDRLRSFGLVSTLEKDV